MKKSEDPLQHNEASWNPKYNLFGYNSTTTRPSTWDGLLHGDEVSKKQKEK